MSGKKAKPEVPLLRVGPGRLSFPALLEKKAIEGGVEKYSTVILLPPDYNVAPILKALEDLCVATWGPRAKWPANARKPESVVRSCDEKGHLAGYEPGWHFISCSSNEKPAVVNGMREPVTLASDIYAGRWANVSMRPFIYNNVGVGVSLGLNNVQVLKHDTAFGRTSAKQDFDDVVEEMADDF